ncbi:MAG: putative membrane protein [Rhodobacteraceae bacterium HLUCCA12]|nr:MAG: putative membrane protein [Rhodobacteraceae bacterium HLUCCA12]
MSFGVVVLSYLFVTNALAWLAFAHDKRAAISGSRRIPEDRLLAIAFLGGSLGAKLGQLLLRHKIRTEPFRQQLNGIIAVQVLALAALWAIRFVQRDMVWLAG